ncbi:MAG: aspartate aminotransferase family protein [Oscillospiraceae bacterium]|jgi:acetylornithine/N-succinyldiaminopimelate aminotransferase|nr:aspartate aminotransferase family protein [Oscillospiraceae bacterium]
MTNVSTQGSTQGAAQAIISRDNTYVEHTYARFPIALVKGQGARCWAADGKEYIDLTSGIGVNSLGFCDPEWTSAVYAQLTTLQHTSNLYYTEPCTTLAEALCTRSGMKKAFFGNSGAEANEGAIKAARKWGHVHHGPSCHNIITLKQSFHGRTLTTLAATGQEQFHKEFDPFPTGFSYAEPNDITSLESMIDENTCAVMIEFVQGEGGVRALTQGYAKAVDELCARRGILLIDDEVQTGIGRTGKLFAYEHYGVMPDIVTCAKGLGGGLPIGAILFGEKTKGTLQPGEHASTFGANPAVCAGALAVLNRLNEDGLRQVNLTAQTIRTGLTDIIRRYSGMTRDIGGLGLMIGVSLPMVSAKDAVNVGIKHGVLTLTAHDRLRLLPPLTITPDETADALNRIEKAARSFR